MTGHSLSWVWVWVGEWVALSTVRGVPGREEPSWEENPEGVPRSAGHAGQPWLLEEWEKLSRRGTGARAVVMARTALSSSA